MILESNNARHFHTKPNPSSTYG